MGRIEEKFSRRELFERGFKGLVMGNLLLGVYDSLYKVQGWAVVGLKLLTNPIIINNLLRKMSDDDLMSMHWENNPEFKPAEEIIEAAVQRCGSVYTRFSDKRINSADVFAEIGRSSLGKMTVMQLAEGLNDSDVAENLKQTAAEAVAKSTNNADIKRVIDSAASDYLCFWDMVRAGGSSLGEEFMVRAKENNLEVDFTESMVSPEGEALAKQVVNERFGGVVKVIKSRGRPAKTSEVLEEFIKLDEGDIGKAIRDMAIFFKAMARNDMESGKFIGSKKEKQNQAVSQFVELFEDEVSVLAGGWNFKQIGLLYHVWESISLLKYADVTTVMMMEAGNSWLSNGGPQKRGSEFRFVEALQRVEDSLRKW